MADGNFDLSAVMRFDGKAAVAGADEVAASLKGVAAANKEIAASAREAASAGGKQGAQPDGTDAKREAQAQRDAAAAAKTKAQADKEAAAAAKALAAEEAALDRELQKIRDSLDPAAAAQRKLNAQLDIAATGFARGKLSASEYDATVKRLTSSTSNSGKEADAAAKALNRNAFGARNLGQQVGDFATQVSLGGGFVRAFSSQAGQAGFALSEMGGAAGKVGAFLVGPWGIALTVGALVLGPFIEGLFKTAEGLAKVELGSSGLADSQGALGDIFDLVTGKLKNQNSELAASNELLRINARLTAINLRVEAQKEKLSSAKALDNVGSISASDRVRGAFEGFKSGGSLLDASLGAIAGTDTGNQNAVNLRAVVNDLRSGKTTREAALKASAKIDFTGLKVSQQEFQGAIRDAVSSEAKNAIADLTDKALDTGNLPGGLRKTDTKKPPKPKKPASTAARDEFGRDAADKIAALKDQLSDTPSVVASVNKQLAQLDDLIDDIGRKKPPGFEKLIADAQTLRPLIEAGLNKPYREYLRSQEEGLAVQRLVTAGKNDEAAALKIVQGLQREMGPLTVEQRDAVLATVQAMREEQREADILRDKQQAYLTALGSIKSAVRGVIFDGVGGLEALPGRLVKAFSTLKGEQLFDKLFDGAFRELEDQAKGTTVVRDASDRMAAAVEKARTSTTNLGAAFDGLTAKVNGTSAPGAGGAASVASLIGSDGKLDAKGLGSLLATMKSAPDPLALPGSSEEVVATARKKQKSPTEFFGGSIEKLARGLGIGASSKDRNQQIADSLKSGIQIKDDAAAKIGRFSGKAISGAATGAFTNSIFAPLAKGLGIKTSKTGAQIGGALGSLSGIPGGDIIGSIAGSVIGGLFKKNNKFGASTLAITDGRATAGTAIGKGASERQQADALGGSLADGLNSVASALGATLGSANVSIGYRPGHKDGAYRVDTTGQGRVTGVEAFDDEKDAIAFALRDAILDGAITGLSAAMQKALSSNADIDRAVSEALGVKALEAKLGGLSGSLKSVFDAEDAAGKERLRLAKAYGIDIVAVEKLNGEQRTKLVADTLASRLGSLTTFSSSIQFGDLAEGTATDKLKALQVEIDKVQKQAEAGVDGAADTLASLLTQKVSQTRDAFGTAGTDYTNARSSAISAVDNVIKMETDRINAAAGIQQATTNAVVAGNTLTSETNDLIAKQNTILEGLPAALAAQIGYAGNVGADYSTTSRSGSKVLTQAY